MSLKICFVIPRAYEYFFPGITPVGGGAEKQCYLLGKALSKYKEFDVHFCLADFGQEYRLSKDNISFWRIHKLSDNKLSGLIKIQKTLTDVNADIYIFRAANPAILFFTFYIKQILKKKVVYMMAHDMEITLSLLKKHTSFLTAILMKITHKYVDLLIVQNKQQLSVSKHRKNKATVIIPNPIDYKKEDITIDFNHRKGAVLVARLDPIKQIELYLQLAAKFPNEKFKMIAPKSLEHPAYGNAIIEALKTHNNINYIEFVPHNLILDYYKQSKIYVMTSEMEGFSNTMMEAMLSGCAMLSLNVNPNGIFDNEENGICANGNYDLFTKYYEKLITDKQYAENLGRNAQQYIIRNHNIDDIIKQMAKSLKDLK